jgi:hypothetical protein
MTALVRIITKTKKASTAGFTSVDDGNSALNGYFDRLYKLIPGEVVGLYLVGSGLIPKEYPFVLLGWSLFCLAALFLTRMRNTKDTSKGLGPQWGAVFISAVSFVIWLYTLGGPFAAFPDHNIYVPFLGSLLVLSWTFLVPLIYSGEQAS